MSMQFSPFYGYSFGDVSGLDFNGQYKLLENVHDALDLLSEDSQEKFYEKFLLQDEFETNSDIIYGVEAYDIKQDEITFNNMNTGSTSFVSYLGDFIKMIEEEDIDLDIQPILDLYENIQNSDISPKVYSVYI